METFSALLAICAENSPHKGQWRGALMLSLICAWINGWVNNCEAGDLRRHRAHYDVIVMLKRVPLTSRRWWWNIKRNTAVCDQTIKPLSWLTRCGLITPHGIIDPEQHWFLCLTQPIHYLTLLWNGHLGTNFDIDNTYSITLAWFCLYVPLKGHNVPWWCICRSELP